MKLFKCYNTESLECSCVEIPLHKGDSSFVSALHRNHCFSIPEVASHWYKCMVLFQIFKLSIKRNPNQPHLEDILHPAELIFSPVEKELSS